MRKGCLMQRVEVELFTDPGNNAVVRLGGRRFPGVLIQGDTLSILWQQAVTGAASSAIALRGMTMPC
jgi:Family of unknown function (DUF6959)